MVERDILSINRLLNYYFCISFSLFPQCVSKKHNQDKLKIPQSTAPLLASYFLCVHLIECSYPFKVGLIKYRNLIIFHSLFHSFLHILYNMRGYIFIMLPIKKQFFIQK